MRATCCSINAPGERARQFNTIIIAREFACTGIDQLLFLSNCVSLRVSACALWTLLSSFRGVVTLFLVRAFDRRAAHQRHPFLFPSH